jgi:hypothetical protein
LLANECTVVCKTDVVKYTLSAPVLKGRLRKWMLALSEFDVGYELTKAVKGQVLADLVAGNNGLAIYVASVPCTLFFDGLSRCYNRDIVVAP